MRMNFRLLAAMTVVGLAGCQWQQQPDQQRQLNTASVMDVRPVYSATPRFTSPTMVATPPPEEPPVATVSDSPTDAVVRPLRTVTPGADSSRTASRKAVADDRLQQGNYKVKKGDTLYRIARTEYGDGKKWTLIASANPGLSPQTLKAGQTILLP